MSLSVRDTLLYIVFFFFFQAEDGIRDGTVTGVQTCALPIFAYKNGMDDFQRIAKLPVAVANLPVGDRKSVVYGKSVDLGGRRIIKKKKKKKKQRKREKKKKKRKELNKLMYSRRRPLTNVHNK